MLMLNTGKYLFIYLIALAAILLPFMKFPKKGERFHDNFLDLDIAKGMQGFAAVCVMLHHLTQYATDYGRFYKGPISFFNEIGVLFTGIFFFFSGYGLYTSLLKKEDYLDTFLRRRLPKVVIPFVVCNLTFIGLRMLHGVEFHPIEKIFFFTGAALCNNHMWYIVEIVVLYLAFFLVFRIIKNRTAATAVMGLVVAGIIAMSLLLGHDYTFSTGGAWFKGEWWYNSTLLFYIGMLIAKHRTGAVGFAKKLWWVLLPVGIVLFRVLYKLTPIMASKYGYYAEWEGHPGYFEKFMSFLPQTGMVIAFVLTLLLLTMKVQFHNGALRFLGTIALELYLSHNFFILQMQTGVGKRIIRQLVELTGLKDGDFFFYLIVFVGGILLAIVLHLIDTLLTKGCDRLLRPAAKPAEKLPTAAESPKVEAAEVEAVEN